jgi:4-hydroxy-tetrahydrodipicolinate reductase
MLGEAAAAGRGASLASVRGAVREGIAGPRSSGAINFAARRGGGIVGEHEAMFAGAHDLLRLSHTALDRSVFAAGAIAAARWAVQQPPGLYTLSDVLGP